MGVNHLTYSGNGLSLTKQFESLRLTAYQDPVGVWTIGYGHTGPDVTSGLTVTQDQAQAWLAQDVSSAADCVNEVVMIALSQNEFDALVDFVFNLGPGNFKASTLLVDLNAGNLAAAANQFDRWDRAGGQVVAGLLRRRQAETDMFTAAATTQTA